ncbi:VacJ family lipoprotein [Thiomicrospira sp.]|uniref:MlaA family lipoprotein n=1 Tax=Thiomicrospira sp. TaxID=935 RepID=UPI0025EB4B78|nr:VacJ family lipoprotein [Thiomicrospira sp.]
MKYTKTTLLACLCILFSSTSSAQMNTEDPYESFNRSMFEFNLAFHDLVGEPVGKSYKKYVPRPARTGIHNFFINLRMPLNMTNNLLQGKVERGLADFMRFTINTVFGFGGLLDIATPAGLPYEKEDFGQTLYKWGLWKESSFVVLPVVGGFTFRELAGAGIDASYNPTYSHIIQTDLEGRTKILVVDQFDNYIQFMDLIDTVRDSYDPYIFYRESYLQYRNNLIYDGKPPQPDLDDFDFN